MPVTAKLSRKFYDRLGEDIANELVEWFNQVDATYRSDLREFNELNYARFEAKLEQRIAELRSDVMQRLTALEARFEARLDVTAAGLRELIESRLREHTRFFFLAWATLLASNLALWFR